MKDLRQRLRATFQVEHTEHVQRIREILATFEPGGAALDLDDVFRRAHSLKGAARAVDLRPLEGLAHRLETLFSRIREGAVPLDESSIRIINQALDASEDWLAASNSGLEPAEPVRALEAIDALLGARPTVPVASPVKSPSAVAPMPVVPHVQVDSMRVNAESLDRIVRSAGQLLTESHRQNHATRQLRSVSDRLAEAAAERDRIRRSGARVFQTLDSSPTLAVAARYLNYVDHQLHLLTKEVSAALQVQARNAWALRSLTGDLQRDVRQARMVPADNVFDGFRKMVRDLGKEAGKTVDLHVSGWQIEADRLVLQALKDPVMHMLRNAISHGLETEDERRNLGKRPGGRIDMILDVRGNRLTVTVEDDGRGIDIARVSAIAIRKGLIAESEIAARPAAELMRLVLLPGFSTSTSVTELSGRGMGLSVVAQAVARLQGSVEIGPGNNGGTRVTLSAPLSISSHRLLLVDCQGVTFAMPLHGIEQLRRVKVADLRTVESKPRVIIDSQPVPIVSLAHLLNATEPRVSVSQNTLCVMIMRSDMHRIAVAVDSFLSEREAIIRDLPAPADGNARIAGGIVLEDGSICLVLNPTEIIEGFRESSDALVLRTDVEAPVAQTRSREILIVDDSLTTRTLEKSVLEAHGYEVAVAVDGVDALRYLRASPVGLVISDLQMPRLDGFGLLEEMKSDPRLSKIPVVIVSSVENPEDQARGLTLGADAYIVKRKFEQHELLETIRQIL